MVLTAPVETPGDVKIVRPPDCCSRIRVSEMSSRLEEGWTLLNQTCPVPGCHTALLRDTRKDAHGEVFCVKCEKQCITAEQAKAMTLKCGSKVFDLHSAGPDILSKPQLYTPPPAEDPATTANATPKSTRSSAPSESAAIQASRASAEERMGEKLLLGWTMLADMCSTPDCCFPLMQDRTGIRVCVSCGSKALPTQQGVDPKAGDAGLAKANDSLRVPVSSVSLTTRDSDGGAQQRQQQPPGDDGGEGAILSKVEFARVRKRRDEVSAALGRYMMQGWAMLEKKCTREGCGPGTPLLKERGTGRLYCVGCQMYSDVDGELGSAGGSQEAATSVSTPLPLKRGSSGRDHGALTVDATSAVAEVEPLQVESEYEISERVRLRKQAAREQENNLTGVSAGLGQRLLQGWAMLSTPCPTRGCNSPLMRDKKGSVSCVSCKNTAADKLKASQTADEVMENDETGEADRDREMLDDDSVRMYSKRRVAELTVSRVATDTVRGAAVVEVGARGTGEVVEHARIKANALDTVYKAIDMSERRLRCCTGEGVTAIDVDESSRQAELLTKLAMAAQALGKM